MQKLYLKPKIEYLILIILILSGLGLRIWGLHALGLNHFDEGVYAISGAWSDSSPVSIYEKQILFSPPLYPFLVGVANWVSGGASDSAAIIVNVLIGTATILVVWWTARRWYGQGAGLIAALLATFSEYLILYARMALTDMLFGFFFILSLAITALAFEKRSLIWAVFAGLSIGAAWNTKYHGWFLIVIALGVLIMLILGRKPRIGEIKQLILCWLTLSLVAGICYLPWIIFAQTQEGGFIALLRYQRTFLRFTWLQNLGVQLQMQLFLDGWLSRLAPVVAYAFAILIRPEKRTFDPILTVLIGVGMLGAGIAFGGVLVFSILSLIAIYWLVRRGWVFDWLLILSLALFFVSTPFYRPYPRLFIPWVLCVFLVGSFMIAEIMVDWLKKPSIIRVKKANTARLFATLFGLCIWGWVIVGGIRAQPRLWMATNEIRNSAEKISQIVPADKRIFVYGVPELAFYLLQAGRDVVTIDIPLSHPLINQRFPLNSYPSYIVTGIYSEKRDPRGINFLLNWRDRLRLLATYTFTPNDERLLNDFTPEEALDFISAPTDEYDLHLYEILSSPAQ